MNTLTLDLPSLYGDHHVMEVRRILLALDGVAEVYASSAFHAVEVAYDPEKIVEVQIRQSLDKAGYLGAIEAPVEKQASPYQLSDSPAIFRRTAVYENTRKTISFARQVQASGKGIWPCPGMGPLKTEE